MDQETLYVFWWAVGAVLLFLEMITPATIFIFPAVVAVLVGFMALLVDSIAIQAIVFFVLSVVAVGLIRPFLVVSKKDVGYKQGGAALMGKTVQVVQTIDNLKAQGKIKHASDFFPARSVDGQIMEEDQWVTIVSIEGITVFVSPIAQSLKEESQQRECDESKSND